MNENILARGVQKTEYNGRPVELPWNLFRENDKFAWRCEDSRRTRVLHGETLAEAYYQAAYHAQHFETDDFEINFFFPQLNAEIPLREANPANPSAVHTDHVSLYVQPADGMDITAFRRMEYAEFAAMDKVYRWALKGTRTKLAAGVGPACSLEHAKELLAAAYPGAIF